MNGTGTHGKWSGAVAAAVLGLVACEQAAPPAGRGDDPPPNPGDTRAAGFGADGWRDCRPGETGEWQLVAGEAGGWDASTEAVMLPMGYDLTGVRWTGAVPAAPFEIELEARRVEGTDFFCGLTVPTRSERECVSLILGGWGGSLVGISSLDDLDASENETGTTRTFENGRWYRIRLRFADEQLSAWIDDQAAIEVDTADRRLSLRPGPIEDCAPFGLATWNTSGEIRGIRWRKVAAEP